MFCPQTQPPHLQTNFLYKGKEYSIVTLALMDDSKSGVPIRDTPWQRYLICLIEEAHMK